MFTKTRIALAFTLVLGSSSLALAQGGYDPNPANRYPAYAEPGTFGYSPSANVPVRMHPAPQAAFQSTAVRLHRGDVGSQSPNATFRSAPVQLRQGRDAGLANDLGNYTGRESEFDVDRNDRASSPYAGGGF